jgi:hypothetical protein
MDGGAERQSFDRSYDESLGAPFESAREDFDLALDIVFTHGGVPVNV